MSGTARSALTPPRPLPLPVRAFHWITAALLALMFALAWTFGWLGPSAVGAALVGLHQSFGLVILAVVAMRLVWRLTHPIEPLPPVAPRWELRLAALVQGALYVLLLAMPLVGWAASAMAGDTVRFFGLALPDLLPMDEDRSDQLFALHETIGWAILALTALHAAAALNHHFIRHDGLLNRMRLW